MAFINNFIFKYSFLFGTVLVNDGTVHEPITLEILIPKEFYGEIKNFSFPNSTKKIQRRLGKYDLLLFAFKPIYGPMRIEIETLLKIVKWLSYRCHKSQIMFKFEGLILKTCFRRKNIYWRKNTIDSVTKIEEQPLSNFICIRKTSMKVYEFWLKNNKSKIAYNLHEFMQRPVLISWNLGN